MASYQIMYWQQIPSQIKVRDQTGTVKKMLPDRFQQAIDSAAMAKGETSSDDYLDGWHWAKKEERPGSAAEVADTLLIEIETAYPQSRLREIISACAQR